MQLLIVEALETELLQWLSERYRVRYRPELALDRRGLLRALRDVDALVIPPGVALDAAVLNHAPLLRAVGRVGLGHDDIDVQACTVAGVDVVRSPVATAAADAAFMVDALRSMLRAVHDGDADEDELVLRSRTVGLIGMTLAGRHAARMLADRGATVFGYEPSLHAANPLWRSWHVDPLPLAPLLERADAMCVQLPAFSRYRGLLGDRLLSGCKQDQVLVSISHSMLFDEEALAGALTSGRVAAVWLDHCGPELLAAGRPLHAVESLRVTPARESRKRSEWAVARALDEVLEATRISVPIGFNSTLQDEPPAPSSAPEST